MTHDAHRSLALRALRALLLVGAASLLHCSSSSVAAGPPPSDDAASPTPDGGNATDAGDDSAYSIFQMYDAAFINMCFPDSDGINGGDYTFDLTVNDTGFSKMILATQNDAQVTLTLMNTGTKPHGFIVGCADVTPAFPTLPAGCPADACFTSHAAIAPLAPGATATITFPTPTPDGVIYPFTSNEPGDSDVPGLNNGQWTLM